ncbi:MAG: Trk system potassium transporter TrkA [Gammaproteobacteria bacterium]|nr:Trk system potassium transporter TrkA [Gammaproteobacteria bacterium]MBV9698335.1 Trk system potassium transporter TrkA [Gammaproteobacteria bacterium]
MKILILGAGQVGRTAAQALSREEANEVTVVDLNEDILRELQDRYDVRTVSGNAAHPSVLEAAGAAEAEIIFALTSSDEVNITACQVAFTLYRTPTKIARIRAEAYTTRADLFGSAGLSVDVFISPEQLVAEYVERLIHHPGTLQVLDFADGKVRLVAVRTRRGGPLVGHRLRELPQHLPNMELRVVAIYRAGRAIVPDGDTAVEDGDEVFFLAAAEGIRRAMAQLRGGDDDPARRLIIAGGGHIGLRLAKTLEQSNQVKLIERDPRRARRISELLDKAIVLQGDAADEELLIEENIDAADVFAAVTNSEEANILSAMLAKRLGAHKVMALINRPSYTELVESSPIDIALSPQSITTGTLLAYVRRGDVVRVHQLRRGAAEALEAVVHGDARSSRVVGRAVAEIPLPDGVTLGAVVRGEQVIMAHHDTRVEADDHVILFLADRRHLEAVERLFVRATR